MSSKRATPQSVVAVPAVPTLEPLLVTTAHAAKLLSISTWEVRRLVRKGLLAHKKLSKTNWLITIKSIRAFADVTANGRAA
jgi:hypothetical protein